MLEAPTTESATQTPAASAPTPTPAPSPAPEPQTGWMDSLDKAFEALNAKEAAAKEPAKEPVAKEPVKEPAAKDPAKEPAKEPGEDEPKGMSAAAGRVFKELKSEVKEWKAKYAALESKAQAAPVDVNALPEVQQLKARLEEQERELSMTRVEATEEYHQSVVEPLNHVLGLAGVLAEKYSVDNDALNKALAETNLDKQSEMLMELAGGFSERDRMGLYRLADDVGVILKRRASIQQNAKDAFQTKQQREAAEKQTKEAALKQTREAAMADVLKVIQSKVPLMADKTIAEDVLNRVRQTDILNAPADVQAYTAYSGALLPHVLRANKEQQSRIAELEQTISDFRKTVPKAGGGKVEASELAEDVDFLTAIEDRMR